MMTIDALRPVMPARPRLTVLAALAVLLTLGFGFGAAQAQNQSDQAVVPHPAHIHVGTCEELDPNPAAPLNSVGPRGFDTETGEMTDDPPETRGSLNAPPVEVSESTADIEFDQLLETSHAINVHESDQNIDVYIACGDIGGQVFDDQLFIALFEQNDSGYFGIAVLEPDGDGTRVTIYLAREAATDGESPVEEETPADETPTEPSTPEA